MQETLKVKIPLSKREREQRAFSKAQARVKAMIEKEGFGEKVEASLKTLMDRIAYVHERWPETKGNYALLTYRVWRVFYGVYVTSKDGDFERIVRLPSPDNIGRIHRFYEENGFYRPSEKTIVKRGVLEDWHRGFWVSQKE